MENELISWINLNLFFFMLILQIYYGYFGFIVESVVIYRLLMKSEILILISP